MNGYRYIPLPDQPRDPVARRVWAWVRSNPGTLKFLLLWVPFITLSFVFLGWIFGAFVIAVAYGFADRRTRRRRRMARASEVVVVDSDAPYTHL